MQNCFGGPECPRLAIVGVDWKKDLMRLAHFRGSRFRLLEPEFIAFVIPYLYSTFRHQNGRGSGPPQV